MKNLNDFKLLQVGWVYKDFLDVIRKTLPESDAIGEIFVTVGYYVDEKLH